jgi:peptidoglycan/LPS O-acetylase OafA/YrhL
MARRTVGDARLVDDGIVADADAVAGRAAAVGAIRPRLLTSIPALDGFRGVAILVVVLYHSTVLMRSVGKYGRGGAFGVDAFFVLSGFLITALLLREQAQRGQLRLGPFYRRRALRLLPALIVLLAAQIIYALLTHEIAVRERDSVLSVLFYYSNTSLHQRIPSPGLEGLWSLAVEEQFYLVWPVVLILFLGLRRKLSTVVVSTTALIVAVSAYRMYRYDRGVSQYYLYTRTVSRADALLVGALVAQLWVRRRLPRRGLTLVAWPALAFFLYAVVWDLPTSFLYRGGYTIVALAVALILVAVLQTSWKVNDVLRLPALRTFGRISYALYIWHLLIFTAVLREEGRLAPAVRLGTALALSAIVVSASWKFVEQPFLRWKDRLESGGQARAAPIRAIAIVAVAFLVGGSLLALDRQGAKTQLKTFAPTSAIVTVPDLRGRNAFAAVSELQRVRLNFALVAQVSRTVVAGTVIAQTPAAHTRVRVGTVVNIVAGKQPPG